MAVPLFDPTTPLAPLRAELRDAADAACWTAARSSSGPEVEAFERELAGYLGTRHARRRRQRHRGASRSRCARWASGPGDEVVVPSFTFYASAEAIPPTGATPVFCDVDPETFCVTRRHGARRAHAAHEGGRSRSTCSATSRRSPRSRRSACRWSRTRRRPPAPRAAGRAAGRARDDRDVLASTRPRTSGASATAARSRPTTTRSPTACGCCASTARATRSPTTRVGYNSRLDELQAAVLRVLLPRARRLGGGAPRGRRGIRGRRAGRARRPCPRPTDGAAPAWHLYVVRHPRADELAPALAARGHRRARLLPRADPPPAGDGGLWARRAELPGTDEVARTHLALPMSAVLTARAGRRGRRRGARCASGSTSPTARTSSSCGRSSRRCGARARGRGHRARLRPDARAVRALRHRRTGDRPPPRRPPRAPRRVGLASRSRALGALGARPALRPRARPRLQRRHRRRAGCCGSRARRRSTTSGRPCSTPSTAGSRRRSSCPTRSRPSACAATARAASCAATRGSRRSTTSPTSSPTRRCSASWGSTRRGRSPSCARRPAVSLYHRFENDAVRRGARPAARAGPGRRAAAHARAARRARARRAASSSPSARSTRSR